MDGVLAGAAIGAAAVMGGAVGAAVVRVRAGIASQPMTSEQPGAAPIDRALLDALPLAVALVGPGEEVVLANAAARRTGLVVGRELGVDGLRRIARQARRHPEPLVGEHTDARVQWSVVAVALDAELVAVVADDRTEARRADEVRRDFVANVGHELKTPVGALSLLAEAVAGASDDPEAVLRFSERMRRETTRLTRLVQDVIDLSRLQGTPAPLSEQVPLDRVVQEALDRTRETARAREIELAVGADSQLVVVGDERQLVTALGNLLDNAVAYSPPETRVGIAVSRAGDRAEVAVTDQGIGVAPAEQARIFERFYRVDPARSRDTGGTGLGLAIVKHVAASHGGEVRVWSREGQGSTFTLSIPLASAAGPTAGEAGR